MSTTETVSLVMAERRTRQTSETEAGARAAQTAVALAKETALLQRRQRDCANRDQASLNASAKTYFAAIDGSVPVTYTIG